MSKCPECGGPCTKKIESSVDLGGPGCTNSYKYESLFGEVVAKGWARKALKTLTSPPGWYWHFYDAQTPPILRARVDWPPTDSVPAILVIRTKASMSKGGNDA